MEQSELEYKYSKKYLSSILIDLIDTKSDIFMSKVQKIKDYKSKDYYQSKLERVKAIKDIPEDELLITILIAVMATGDRIVPVQGVATKIAYYLGLDNLIKGVITSLELLAVTEEDYFDLYYANHEDNTTGTLGVKCLIKIPKEMQQQIDLIQYLPPMKCKPRNWSSNFNGGYLTIPDCIILNNSHNKTVNLEAINRLQQIKLCLSNDMLTLKEEIKNPPETLEQKQQFNKLKEDSRTMYDLFKDQPFWFVWKYDTRGRMYSQGYHINIQGSEYKRSLIELHQKECVTC